MANKIENLPHGTLVCIIKNIKQELSKGKKLTELNIKYDKNINAYNLEYYWDDDLLGDSAQ